MAEENKLRGSIVKKGNDNMIRCSEKNFRHTIEPQINICS
jgi:hypothetical protein